MKNTNNLFSYSIDQDDPPEDFLYTASFNITLIMLVPNEAYTNSNTDPYFTKPVPNALYAVRGQAFQHDFGDVYDHENDQVSIEIDFGEASTWVEFDPDSNRLTIAELATIEL